MSQIGTYNPAVALPGLPPVEDLLIVTSPHQQQAEKTHQNSDFSVNADCDKLLQGLNPQQQEAVTHSGSPLLIIAGAGSGKTRVLTHRIAYLLCTGRARAGEILAITFTNKAAAEMRERVNQLVGATANRMWVFTFHSACVRILREQYQAAGMRSSFTIYDAADSQKLLGIITKNLNIDTKRFTLKLLGSRISDLKNELITWQEYQENAPNDPVSKVVAQVYQQYQRQLTEANAVDFDDLIMKVVQLLQSNPAVAEHYRRRFRHILVDEYQDTNHAQYVLVRELIGNGADLPAGELTVVGDSDQSIYAFRGATIRNIEEFEKDFQNAHTVVLEQNYRSTQNILSAANAVISKNYGRRAKALWTASGAGELIAYDAAESEYDEAKIVVQEISRLTPSEYKYGEIAIFYRTNSQSRALEEQLVRAGIPYRVVGGTKFYERKEIKDALAYLQVIANPDDAVAIRRIINTPRRGIGDKAEQVLAAHAQMEGISFGAAARQVWIQKGCDQGEAKTVEVSPAAWEQQIREALIENPAPLAGLTARALNSIAAFWGAIETMQVYAKEHSIAEVLDQILDVTGYLEELRRSKDPQDLNRVENLAELHSVATDFAKANPTGQLHDFLERVALVADADQVASESENAGEITLMTVHTAKGLEFPVVFVTGLEDGTFPHQRSLMEVSELAEERRLAYVAITRARKKLYLSRAAVRSAWGTPTDLPPSRFLDDIPSELLEIRRGQTQMDRYRSGGYGAGNGIRNRGTSYRQSSSATEGYAAGSADDDFAPAFGSGLSYRGPRSASEYEMETLKSEATLSIAQKLSQQQKQPAEATSESEGISLKIGDKVRHASYGTGIVIGMEGSGKSTVANVDFGDGKGKRLMLRYAPLEKL
ncbi:UvrD-helicase domain-containing protein [Gleimia sp. 6138-11-ORH1]|uniref:UvrD-helicase domain-containing protein n=1 Tax=Gleimia sp. 6138-11-ORH1 TaxID=2973937 RepID=UPI00216A8923|nr:UvrD-helicase domain-containing protein [Gleimia sp. 6138-11-ORH1]MCS4485185.1 UvrD-helicase domain-containing protein [Gleimia sp. 6138-11-ORH1]